MHEVIMAKTLLEPSSINLDSKRSTDRWMVVIYNNSHNTFDDVIYILIKATSCSLEEAYIETWEAHHYGKACVHFAEEAECTHTACMISAIGVRTEVCKEWP